MTFPFFLFQLYSATLLLAVGFINALKLFNERYTVYWRVHGKTA